MDMKEHPTQEGFSTLFARRFPFWDQISPEERRVLTDSASRRLCRKGEHLHGSGGCTGAILVESGCLRTYLPSEDGREITLYRLFPGDICMLSASCVLNAITFDVAVDAEEDSSCVIIAGNTLAALAERSLPVKVFALEAAVDRFSEVMWVMQQILFMSFDRRLAVFLWDETAKSGSDTVNLTHEQIARYMGTAREVVTRMLRYFTAEGIVESRRGTVRILDRDRLRALAFHKRRQG